MTKKDKSKATVQLWRDSVQTIGGHPIFWVVLIEDGAVKETLNQDRERWFTDPVEAIMFAASEAKARGIAWEPKIRHC